jgi:hypothetical protein
MNGSRSDEMRPQRKSLCHRSHGLVVLSLFLLAGIVSWPRAASGFQAPPSRPPETLEPNRETVRVLWGESSSFVIPGQAGAVITLRANSKSPGLDPHLCLLDPENRVEAFDDDGGEHGNSLIKDHALKQDGQYTIVIGLDSEVQGEVEILLERAASSGGEEPGLGPVRVVSSSELSCEAPPPNP